MKEAFLNLFYQYSKVLSFGFNRKRFELVVTENSLFAVNNSKNTFAAILFTLFLSYLLFPGLIELVKGKTPLTIDFVIPVLIIMPILGIIGLKQFIWLVNGRQELLIESGVLLLRKKGTFFTKEIKYNLQGISNIREAYNEDELTLVEKTQLNIGLTKRVLFKQTLGVILFKYQYDTIKVFNELDADEKKELIAAIIKLQNNLNDDSSAMVH